MKVFEANSSLRELTGDLIADLCMLVKHHRLDGRHVTLIVTDHREGGEVDAAVATTITDHEEFLTALSTVVDRLCAPYEEPEDDDAPSVTPVKRTLQ